MSLDKLKLSKALVAAMTDAGFLTPKEIQVKTMSRILGGQDVIAVGPEGSGKTTTYVLAALMKLKYAFEEAPRALILVPDADHVAQVLAQFKLLNRNNTFRILGIDSSGSIEVQMNEITDGVDIIVAVPDRARALYLKLALNTNKIQFFIVDNAELIIKKGLQLPVVELANSAYKAQHIIFTEVVHEKLNLMIAPFMKFPATIEVEDIQEKDAEVYQQLLYQAPNFRTKLNLLTLLLGDVDFFSKVVVFVNTRLTAQTVYKNFNHINEGEYSIYKSLFFDDAGYDEIEDFKDNPEARVLIVANENLGELNIQGIPFIFHFELPEQKETFIRRMVKHDDEEVVSVTFSTDIELSEVKKIEQAIGQRMEVMELPEDLKIDDSGSKSKKKKSVDDAELSDRGAAFHEKKASNLKNYNYSAGTKAKMTYKNKKGLS